MKAHRIVIRAVDIEQAERDMRALRQNRHSSDSQEAADALQDAIDQARLQFTCPHLYDQSSVSPKSGDELLDQALTLVHVAA
jgi:preprotein translocase subunit SecF